MPLLDIEKVIERDELRSRFRLVHVAGLRARELNAAKDDTVEQKVNEHYKVTTNALTEIIKDEISFKKIDE